MPIFKKKGVPGFSNNLDGILNAPQINYYSLVSFFGMLYQLAFSVFSINENNHMT